MTIQIRQISESDIESFHRCLDAVARERKHLALTEAPPLDGTRAFVKAVIAAGAVQLVAIDGNSVVGWCDILPKSHEGFAHTGALGMGVLASHRRHGIGERLVTSALERARAAGLERVELEVFASNKPAIAVYEKLGFAREGVKRRARKIDGSYDDIVIMASV